MIRVTIELWPTGDETKKRHLGSLDIANLGDHPEHPRRGNYRARFWGANHQALLRAGEVRDHRRRDKPVFTLRKILEAAGY